MVDHKVNGYLANAFESQDLAIGVEWILNNSAYNELCVNARKKGIREFDYKVVAKRYVELYNNMINS